MNTAGCGLSILAEKVGPFDVSTSTTFPTHAMPI